MGKKTTLKPPMASQRKNRGVLFGRGCVTLFNLMRGFRKWIICGQIVVGFVALEV